MKISILQAQLIKKKSQIKKNKQSSRTTYLPSNKASKTKETK